MEAVNRCLDFESCRKHMEDENKEERSNIHVRECKADFLHITTNVHHKEAAVGKKTHNCCQWLM